jgi:tetratricopeptide (TPR) repeat protein
MSYGQKHPPFDAVQVGIAHVDIVQAEAVRRNHRGCWLAALGIFAVIATMVIVAAAVPLRMFQARTPADPDQDFAFARESLQSKARGIGKRDLKSLEAFFEHLLKSLRGEDRKPFLEFVNLDRFFEQTKQYPEFGQQTLFTSAFFRLMLGENLFSPHSFQRCDIVHAHRTPDRRDVTLMTYCWDGEHAVPMVWWLTHAQGEWRIYDWNALPFGERASLRMVRRSGLSEFSDLYTKLARWDLPSTLDTSSPTYRETLDELFMDVDAGLVPDNLRDSLLLAAAYNATYFERGRAALEALKRCRHPDQVPGFHYLEALVRDYQGNPELALRALERYEAVLGAGPDIGRMKAQLLANLARYDEAHAAWRGLLRFLPENEQVLRECLLTSAGNPPDELLRVLTRLPTLESFLIRTAAELTDPKQAPHVEWLAAMAREHLPESCADSFLSGVLARLQDDIPQAEYFLRRAVDLFQHQKTAPTTASTSVVTPGAKPAATPAGGASPDDVEPLNTPLSYLRSMLIDEDADALMVYLVGDDREEAFRYLAMQHELGEIPTAGFRRVVVRHRELQPKSPAGIVAWSHHLKTEGREQEALDLLTSSVESGIHDPELLQEWVERMVRAGRTVQAYQKYPRMNLPPGTNPFERIAVHCQGEPLRDQLAALIAVHRPDFPSDPMLPIYEAILAGHEHRWDEADAMLAAQLATTGDAPRRSSLTQWRIKLRLRAERLTEIFPQVDPAGEYFGIVMHHAIELRQWQVAEQLALWLRSSHLPPDLKVYWRAELSAKMGNDTGCVQELLLRPDQMLSSPYAYFLRRHLLRSLLRLNRLDEAWNQAESWWNHDNDAIHCLQVAIARRDLEQALRLAESLRKSGGSTEELYLADAIAEPLWSPEFARFRAQYPPHVSYRFPGYRLIAIWSTPPADTQAIVRAVTGTIRGDDTVSLDWQSMPRGEATTFTADSRVCLVTRMHGPLIVDGKEIRADDGSTASLPSAGGEWWGIELAGPGAELYGESRSRLMQGLFDAGCAALYLPNHRQLVPVTADVRERLTRESESDWSCFPAVSVDLYPIDEAADEPPVSRRFRRLAARQLAAAETGTLRVVVRNQFGSAQEQLELTNIRPHAGTQVLRGRLVGDSKFDPQFRQGEIVEFTETDILAMSAAHAESVHSGGK